MTTRSSSKIQTCSFKWLPGEVFYLIWNRSFSVNLSVAFILLYSSELSRIHSPIVLGLVRIEQRPQKENKASRNSMHVKHHWPAKSRIAYHSTCPVRDPRRKGRIRLKVTLFERHKKLNTVRTPRNNPFCFKGAQLEHKAPTAAKSAAKETP